MRKWKPDKTKQKEQARLRALIIDLKRVPCADCGLEYPPEVMDFDHVPGRGGKLGPVSSRRTQTAILEEARKCDVVCANCHRLRTRARRHDLARVAAERAFWLDGVASAVEREREALKGTA